jgi:hypothetical protein
VGWDRGWDYRAFWAAVLSSFCGWLFGVGAIHTTLFGVDVLECCLYNWAVFDQGQKTEFRPLKWFLTSGAVGIVVAIVLTELMIHDLVSGTVALALWPSSIASLVDPRSFGDKMLTMIFTFGGEFILYGVAGLLLGNGINAVRTFILRR